MESFQPLGIQKIKTLNVKRQGDVLFVINNITIPIQQQIVKKFAVVAAVNFKKLKEKGG